MISSKEDNIRLSASIRPKNDKRRRRGRGGEWGTSMQSRSGKGMFAEYRRGGVTRTRNRTKAAGGRSGVMPKGGEGVGDLGTESRGCG